MAQVKVSFAELKQKYGYVIRYAILPANSISNTQGPDQYAIADFSEQGMKQKKATAEAYIRRKNKESGFYEKLEADILENGVENPILISAGRVPDYMIPRLHPDIRNKPRQIVACIHGGSRLWIAQKHDLKVPCVINDWVDKFKDARLITNEGELLTLYKAPPQRYKFGPNGLAYNSLPHFHLERD